MGVQRKGKYWVEGRSTEGIRAFPTLMSESESVRALEADRTG